MRRECFEARRALSAGLLACVLFLCNPPLAAQSGPPRESSATPLALLTIVESLGQGPVGTVVGVVVQVAPEDRDRLGQRARVTLSLLQGEQVRDSHSAVVEVEADGSMMLYRDWPAGTFELRTRVESLENNAGGVWIGEVVVTEQGMPFEAPTGALPDAVALQVVPPRDGAVEFKPPPEFGGIGALQLEVEAPEGTAKVEFFRDGRAVSIRNREPWTVSVSLGQVMRRTVVTAVARDEDGRYLGEDAIVLNSPSGQLGVEILLGPEPQGRKRPRAITVSVTGEKQLSLVTLHLDDDLIARWARCPCVAEIAAERLDDAALLAAEALDVSGVRGDAVLSLFDGQRFGGTVEVELVELPVVVLDKLDRPVTGLTTADFRIFEDERPVTIEGFGTTADLNLSLALAVDTSGSMLEEFPRVREAVEEFGTALLGGGDSVLLITFAWEPVVQVDWADGFEQIPVKLARVTPNGGTSLHDTVVHSLEQFRGRRGRQAVVLLTDGEDTTSRTGWDTALRFARTMRIPVFPIGLGLGRLDFSSRRLMGELAQDTGGDRFFPKKAEQLTDVYRRIGELLRSQYVLWYSSNSEKSDDEFRHVRVEVNNPDHRVRTIRGYYPGK